MLKLSIKLQVYTTIQDKDHIRSFRNLYTVDLYTSIYLIGWRPSSPVALTTKILVHV